MRRSFSTVVLATLAALVWAPLTVSAAPPNALADASATPTLGTTATVFVLQVHFIGANGARATSVTADVAGLALPMVLWSGTATDGTWSAASLLPAGTWPTAFASTVDRGNAATLDGPTVSVGAATPTPGSTAGWSTAPTDSPTFAASQPAGGNPVVEPAGSATPVPGTATASPPAADAPAAGASPGTQTAGSGSGGATVASSPPRTTAPGPAAQGGGSGSTSIPGAAAPGSPATGPGPSDHGAAPVPQRSELSQTMVLTVIGVGLLALTGVVFMLLGGRDRRKRAPAPAGARRRVSTHEVASAADDPEEVLARAAEVILGARAVRRSRIRAADDPVLRAMGLGPDDPPPTPGSRGTRRGRSRPNQD